MNENPTRSFCNEGLESDVIKHDSVVTGIYIRREESFNMQVLFLRLLSLYFSLPPCAQIDIHLTNIVDHG